jgi:mono/diheme cytochrome c family protein
MRCGESDVQLQQFPHVECPWRGSVRIVTNRLISGMCGIALILALSACYAACARAQDSDVYHPASEEHPTSGKQDFMNHCAPCHGNDGKGNGPELKVLPDLPNITLKNGGVFPREKVADMVDGRKAIPSHKRFDMPFWGVNFQQEGKEFTPESEAKAKARIDALVNYVESIQRQ